ncbi:NUDIX domain-containing protein [Pseudalkalibacillus sp. R45]|uniref:NUDIX domain-containing protein n=1 Tax=Pseudalkalibacillus sp. R45 TaxID=3457433 RepID=UPI003FCC8253
MLSQAVVMSNDKILMVKQWVQRGELVWNFPGGGIERGETPEEACIREVREETGYEVKIERLLFKNASKYTFVATIIGGTLKLDTSNPDNADLVDIQWVPINDHEKFDSYTVPLIDKLNQKGSFQCRFL